MNPEDVQTVFLVRGFAKPIAFSKPKRPSTRPRSTGPTEDARDGVRDIIGHYEELLQECVRVENEKYDARLAEGERLAVFCFFRPLVRMRFRRLERF